MPVPCNATHLKAKRRPRSKMIGRFGLLVSMLAACSDSAFPSTSSSTSPSSSSATEPATSATPQIPENPLPEPDPGDELAQTLYAMVGQYAITFEPQDETRGELSSGAFRDIQTVLAAGRCYKVFGAGEASVEDLDLILFNPSQVQLAQDISADARPALGLTSSICIRTPGLYRVQVRMTRGHGKFAIRVMRSQMW